MENEIIEHNASEVATVQDLVSQDFESTRTAFIDLIDKGNQGLETALEIMRDTEGQPRCVEAFTSLLKTVADINVQFLKLHEIKGTEITKGSSSGPAVLNQTANFFSGSTDDLQQMLKSLGKK